MLVFLFCLGVAVVGSSATDTTNPANKANTANNTAAITDKTVDTDNAVIAKENSDDESDSLSTTSSQPSLDNTEALSGTVRFIRKMDKMEVFFAEHKDQFILPHTIYQPEIMAKLTESMKNKKPITFYVRNRSIVFAGNVPTAQNNGPSSQNTSSGVGASPGAPSSHSSQK